MMPDHAARAKLGPRTGPKLIPDRAELMLEIITSMGPGNPRKGWL